MSLVEVMVAVVIMGIISPLIYGLYTNLYKYYYTITNRTDSVLSAIVVKRQLDRYWSEIDSVLELDPESIRYLSKKGGVHEIAIRKDELFFNTKRLAKVVTDGKFFLETSSCNPEGTLVWEMKVKERWISGVGD